MNASKRIVEICANSVQSCMEAEAGGATRVELCAGIPEGGTTPSYGTMMGALRLSGIDVNIIIRPRGGDFVYTPVEIETMLDDIEIAHEKNISGFVFGCLKPDGSIDTVLLDTLMAAAYPFPVTFHRAFDVCKDPFEALDQLIAAGCARILTSGQQPTAEQGIPLIKELVKRAGDRIIIMPGCGINEGNIARIEAETGAREFHASARSVVKSQMQFRNENVPMGSAAPVSEFETVETDRNRVSILVNR